MLHGRVSPGVEIKIKSVCSTRPHTRACNLALWHKSIYPIGLARPSTHPDTRACMAIFRAHGLATRECMLDV
ncbi:Glutathione S-transferase theta-1 [Gossypium arboreum]|uniref:Glutathione S-transferase theta-1 n=1 Tax=Gossypium arboreum TaxID=29729 RepID=A0A0B0PDB9_GOSAR|nr:Glutathione S-transferase theta-1 [Gossypium arboreum]